MSVGHYTVHTPTGATTVCASDACIEASGALVLYVKSRLRSEIVLAFAPGTWRAVHNTDSYDCGWVTSIIRQEEIWRLVDVPQGNVAPR